MPLIWTTLKKGQISALEKHADIVGIYPHAQLKPMLDESAKTIRAPQVWWYNGSSGYAGSGRKVAVVEPSSIYFNNPYLADTGVNRFDECINLTGSLLLHEGHSTEVAGAIGSTHPKYQGIAYQATVLGAQIGVKNANGTVDCYKFHIDKAMTWAYNNGAKVHNHSYTFPGLCYSPSMFCWPSRDVDDFSWTYGVTMVASAGNGEDNLYVSAPAHGYNVIGVGVFNDNNSESWTDDVMWEYSSYKNIGSANGDREKPEIVAPSMTTITTSKYTPTNGTEGEKPWLTLFPVPYPYVPENFGVGGTSIAAPHVSAAAALLMENPTLRSWPTAIKAILMATAVNDLDGYSPLPYWNSNILADTQDGAGGIDVGAAYTLSKDTTKWKVKTVTSSSFTNGYAINLFEFSCSQGQRIRAVIAWDTPTGYLHYPDQPGADLDLSVWNSDSDGRTSYGYGSGTMDNTYEIVDFTAVINGTCYVNVNKYRFNQGSAHLAAAWYAY